MNKFLYSVACVLAAGLVAPPIKAAPADDIIQLDAKAARIHGSQARFMVVEGIGNICSWIEPKDWLSWEFSADQPGEYVVELKYSCRDNSQGSTFAISAGDQKLDCKIAEPTGTWDDHEIMKLGNLTMAQAGKQTLALKPTKKPGEAVMNLVWLRLIPVGQYAAYMERSAKERQPGASDLACRVFVVPNFHPASCGWLADFSTERSYCANNYLDHLDRVRDDRNYAFALSEVNNQMAILEFWPDRFEEIKHRLREGRVELSNAFFLEPTINLSGGEALVKSGVEGLRWQQQVMGVRPRFAWMIDVTGTHEQMAQITGGLGLEALVYCRHNPTGRALHWAESPDGTRALAISPGHYSEWGPVFNSTQPLSTARFRGIVNDLKFRSDPAQLPADEIKQRRSIWGGSPQRAPAGAPVIILAGSGDYSLAPRRKEYPTEFLQQLKPVAPNVDVTFSTPSKYLDAVLPGVKSGKLELPTMRGGTAFSFNAFWIQNPRVKQAYRRCEQQLQAAEKLATIASLKAGFAYPVDPLYHAWLLMLLNMDRNTLWGAAGGMVFEHPTSWDASDRFATVEKISNDALTGAMHKLASTGQTVTLFNPLNWDREDPVAGMGKMKLSGLAFHPLSAGEIADKPTAMMAVPLIETRYYRATMDTNTGALVSLKLKSSGREMLGGPANVVVAEKPKVQHGDPGDYIVDRELRQIVTTSSQFKPTIRATTGKLGTTLEIESEFHGGSKLRRIVRFYDDYPRIDFETELHDIPDRTVVVAEFPLAEDITEVRRGIPYGFSHGAWSKPNPDLHGWTKGIVPAVRWSHYTLAGGGGVALLDRGVTGRELTGRTPIIFLLNATDKYNGYPNAWLSGKGLHKLEYALVAHDTPWEQARIPQMAWEYNCPPIPIPGCAAAAVKSVLQTSDNVIVEALRREGGFIEMRLAECFGKAGQASVTLHLPHKRAQLTDLVGNNPQPISGGPTYQFPVRPQQIVTLRFQTAEPVAEIKPLLKWDELVPANKLPMLKKKLPEAKGHPPRGS